MASADFSALPASDNPNYRTATIDALLPDLSPWEKLYLRKKLRHQTFPSLAGMASLPPEIVCEIAQHLNVGDVFRCRSVSRSWYAAWDHGAVASYLCRRFFPGLLEIHAPAPQSSIGDVFVETACRYLRRHYARPMQQSFIFWNDGLSSAVFQNQKPPNNDHESPGAGEKTLDSSRGSGDSRPNMVLSGDEDRGFAYEDNKIAWSPSNNCVIIDDLRTRRRQTCFLSEEHLLEGRFLRVEAVTKDMVIVRPMLNVFESPRNVMCVWHLHDEQWQTVTLPKELRRCFAHGERAAFVTRAHRIISWCWHGETRKLDNDGGLSHLGPSLDMGVIYHPTRPNVLFGVRLYQTHDRCHFKLVLDKYEDGKPIKRFEQHLSKAILPGEFPAETYCEVICRRMNSHGLYCAAALCLDVDTHNVPGGIYAIRDITHPHSPIATVAFNVFTETFATKEYDYELGDDNDVFTGWRCMVWNDTLLYESKRVKWIRATNSETERGQFKDTWYKSAYDAQGDLERCLYSCPNIYSDDDFLLFKTKEGILVWAFCRVPKFPNALKEETIFAQLYLGDEYDSDWINGW